MAEKKERTTRYSSIVKNVVIRLKDSHNPKTALIRKKFFEKENAFFRKNIKNQIVLVAGSGLGHDSFELAKYNKRIFGLELFEPLLDLAQRKARDERVSNVKFIKGDFFKTKFPDKFFDSAVLNMGTICDFEEKEKILKELLRISHTVFFDYYPPTPAGLRERKKMYEQDGWIGAKIDDKTIVSADGLCSNSLSEKDLKEIAFNLNAKYKIFPLTSFAKMVKLTRKTI